MFPGDLNYYVATTDGTASAGPCRLWGYVVISDGSHAGTVSFLDGVGGTQQWYDVVPATANASVRYQFPVGLKFPTALYIDQTTIGTISVIFE
ncbi:MAG: hypothetical protein PHF64_00450 [Methanoregula sp.]|nr:hypothetical protein [Methanoregula sp.]